MASSDPRTSGPTVSVILVSYNQSEYLRESVESVLAQTFDDYELLIIDNGSTDGSQEILREYETAPRVRLLMFDEHGNLGLRFNQGIAAAQGEFISFLYSDDYYLPDKLARQVERLRSLPPDYGVVYAAAQRVNVATGQTWVEMQLGRSGDVFEDFMLRSHHGTIEMITPMTRRTCYLERPFDEDIFFESESIFYRIALSHKFFYIDEPLTVARDHASNGGKAFKRNLDMTLACLDLVRRDPALRADQRPLVNQYEAWLLQHYGWIGARLLPDTRWIRRCFYGAVRRSPRRALNPRIIVGLGLTALPPRIRQRVNDFGHRLKGSPRPQTYIEDYEGLLPHSPADREPVRS